MYTHIVTSGDAAADLYCISDTPNFITVSASSAATVGSDGISIFSNSKSYNNKKNYCDEICYKTYRVLACAIHYSRCSVVNGHLMLHRNVYTRFFFKLEVLSTRRKGNSFNAFTLV